MCTPDPQFVDLQNRLKLMFESQNSNTIFEQLRSLTWNAAIFHAFDEARKTARSLGEGRIALNGNFHRFVDESHHDSQMIGIRRLNEPQHKDKDKAVWSIRVVLDELAKNCGLLTRANLTPHWTSTASPSCKSKAKYWNPAQSGTFSTPEPEWAASLHGEMLDRLCGVSLDKRDPGDLVPESILESMASSLKLACDPIKMFVNKHRAHAADPKTITTQPTGDAAFLSINPNQIDFALEQCTRVANFLAVAFLGLPSGGAWFSTNDEPMFPVDDDPFFNSRIASIAETAFRAFGQRVASWTAPIEYVDIIAEIVG